MKTSLKRIVWARDRYTCQYCGEKNLKEPTVDHIKPKSSCPTGEKSSMGNLVTACKKCNQMKADLPIEPHPTILLRKYQVHV